MIEGHSHSPQILASEKFDSLRKIYLDFAGTCSANEMLVLHFIWMRTIFWGKRREFIKTRHFVDGVPGDIPGLPLSAPTVKRCIKSLSNRGVIGKQSGPYGCWFEIIFEEKQGNVVMLRTPKNDRSGQSTGLKQPKNRNSVRYQADTARYHSDTTYKYENNKYENKGKKESESLLSQSLPGGQLYQEKTEGDNSKNVKEDIQGRLNKASARSRIQHEKKMERARHVESVQNLQVLWDDLVRKTFPEVPLAIWTVKQRGQVSKFRNAFHQDEKKRLWPFLKFCIENWHRISKLRFGWMKDITVPEYPDISFLMGFKKHFLIAFADEKFHDRQIGATAKEREIRKLKRMGYTDEQAEQAYLDQLKTSSVLQKDKVRADRAEREAQAAQWERKQTEKELRFMKAQQGRELMKQKEDLNPDAKKSKRKMKYDADGYSIFEEGNDG